MVRESSWRRGKHEPRPLPIRFCHIQQPRCSSASTRRKYFNSFFFIILITHINCFFVFFIQHSEPIILNGETVRIMEYTMVHRLADWVVHRLADRVVRQAARVGQRLAPLVAPLAAMFEPFFTVMFQSLLTFCLLPTLPFQHSKMLSIFALPKAIMLSVGRQYNQICFIFILSFICLTQGSQRPVNF